MQLVGLDPDARRPFPEQFSGGQRQRIAIARALAVEPKLIVLDEPVSSLDVSIQAGVINLLEDLQAKLGVSYLFVAHNLSVVRHIADRIAVMYLGRIVEIGEVERVFTHPRHPYTRALLSAVPIPDPKLERGKSRILLSGDLPSCDGDARRLPLPGALSDLQNVNRHRTRALRSGRPCIDRRRRDGSRSRVPLSDAMNARTLLIAAAASLSIVAGCGDRSASGPAAGTAKGSAPATTVEPPEGVPAGTRPLPLPDAGKAYNNPQPRDNIRDGGTLTLPIAELGPNFNGFSVDGGSGYMDFILNWILPAFLFHFGVTGGASPNTDYLLSAELVSENPETVKYTLNPMARWNDGSPIDWTAFETTWKTQSGDDSRYNPAIHRRLPLDRQREEGREGQRGHRHRSKSRSIRTRSCSPRSRTRRTSTQISTRPAGSTRSHPELLAGPFTARVASRGAPRARSQPEMVGRSAEARFGRHPADGGRRDGQRVPERRDRHHDGRRRACDRRFAEADQRHDRTCRSAAASARRLQSTCSARTATSSRIRRRARRSCSPPIARLIVEIRYQGMDWKEVGAGLGLMMFRGKTAIATTSRTSALFDPTKRSSARRGRMEDGLTTATDTRTASSRSSIT